MVELEQWVSEWGDLRHGAIVTGVAGGRGQRAAWWLARVQRYPALYAHATRSMPLPRGPSAVIGGHCPSAA